MGEIVKGLLAPVGYGGDPFSGRMWVRSFEHGAVEVTYCASRGPGQAERLNVWLAEAGIDARVTARDLNPLAGMLRPEASTDEAQRDADNAERSARRARQRIRYYCKAVGADRMLTLTTRANITDLAESKAQLQRFMASVRKVYRSFKYVAVPEQQERGAWHWHFGIRGWVDVNRLRYLWWRALGVRCTWVDGKPRLPAGVESPGNVDLRPPRTRGQNRRTWQADSMSAYMGKYITKAVCGGIESGACYSASRGLSWTVERYAVRAATFDHVVALCFDEVNARGLVRPYWFQSSDRTCLWFAGSVATPG